MASDIDLGELDKTLKIYNLGCFDVCSLACRKVFQKSNTNNGTGFEVERTFLSLNDFGHQLCLFSYVRLLWIKGCRFRILIVLF